MIRRHDSAIAADRADLGRVRHVDAPTSAILLMAIRGVTVNPLTAMHDRSQIHADHSGAGACGRTWHATPPERRRAPVIVGSKKNTLQIHASCGRGITKTVP